MPEERYGLGIAIIVAIVVIAFIYSHFKGKANLKKAATGADKARFQEAVKKVMGEGNYTIAYAHWEKVEYYGRTTRTTYYHHALAFDDSRLWIMPLRFEKELILPDKPILATSEMLGIVDVNSHVDKKTNKVTHVGVTLNDKDGKVLVNLYVDSVNTKEDRFHHLNLLQEEECEQFFQFISSMSGKVSADNADLPDRLKEEHKAKMTKYARNCVIPGIIFSILFPFVGLLLGVIGLIYAPKPKATGGKPQWPFLLAIACIVLSIVCFVVFLYMDSPLVMLFNLFAGPVE